MGEEEAKQLTAEDTLENVLHRLSVEIAKNEAHGKEIAFLKKEMEDMRLIYTTTLDIATVIEEHLHTQLDWQNNEIPEEIQFPPEQVINLTRNLALEISQKETIERENRKLKKELKELRMINTTVIQHASILEEELETKYEEVARASISDPLTGIYNRAGFFENFNKLLKMGKKEIAVLMVDIDHFKKVNDTYGHDIGDLVLQNFVFVVEQTCRREDIFARWGGEEFILSIPGIENEICAIVAERIRRKVEEHIFPEVGRITCSIGLTQFRNVDSIDSLIKRVDEGLYAAKRGGRNRVEFV